MEKNGHEEEWLEKEDVNDDIFLTIDLDQIFEQNEKLKQELGKCAESDNISKKPRKDSDSQSTSCTTNLIAFKKPKSKMETPLYRLRFGRIWVSHVMAQAWCEQQLVYDLDPPPEVLEGQISIIEPLEVKIGASLHLARELEVEKVVDVQVTSREDRFALKVINLCSAVEDLVANGSPVRREIPIFGIPFKLGVFVIGVIDEIRCKDENSKLELELVEFKTRRRKELPGKAQIRTHRLQVMIYKKLFDDLVMGVLDKYAVAKNMNLNLNKVLDKEVIELTGGKTLITVGLLLDNLFEKMKGVPLVAKISIEYAFQRDSTTIGALDVKYTNEWLKMRLGQLFQYWKGERDVTGVDIEESWKCGMCFYSDLCKWRMEMINKLADYQKSSKLETGLNTLNFSYEAVNDLKIEKNDEYILN
ncbi:Mitochondrial 5'-3' exonuclease and sliding exonuclease [Chamberlinius hualienensis]